MSQIKCNKCGNYFEQTVKVQKLGKKENRMWASIGIECPHCKSFFHSYFTHDKLEKRRKKLKKIKNENRFRIEQARIKEYHQAEQERAKELFLDK